MGDSLTIGEVADRAGVSAAAVRYYERIGVLPAASRSGNGYRTYDERTVERLVFVNRAKRLGCSLEDVADLMLAWTAVSAARSRSASASSSPQSWRTPSARS